MPLAIRVNNVPPLTQICLAGSVPGIDPDSAPEPYNRHEFTSWGGPCTLFVAQNPRFLRFEVCPNGDATRPFSFELRVPTTYVESADQVMSAVRDAVITSLIRRSLRLQIVKHSRPDFCRPESPRDPYELRVAVQLAADFPRDMCWPVKIEFRKQGTTEQWVRCCMPAQDQLIPFPLGDWAEDAIDGRLEWADVPHRSFDAEAIDRYGYACLKPSVQAAVLDPNGWTVHVSGDCGLALVCWDYEKYWAGEFELPLKELLDREQLGDSSAGAAP